MVTGPARIDSLAEALARLAAPPRPSGEAVVVTVDRTVPTWLPDLVAAARAERTAVVIDARHPAHLGGEALAGWEIGVCTAAFAAGAADVLGVDPRRVARVREVDARLDSVVAPTKGAT